ncbi:MAG: imidazoleglycerol-phosphate dehydratase HisB [Eubacteriaceae bacterium]|jgi:imidazoleglycerol-phosphate dehydratase|nr:imidazoleglycerol-phosphate dehydratase HisB [Eubacteriaceae bacterium]
MREATAARQTKETNINLSLSLDEWAEAKISTGIGFFDHMLELFAVHSGFGITLTCIGDINVDSHHTVEDVGIVLGEAILNAVGDKRGIERYGFSSVPMDEALVNCSLDLSGRPYTVFNITFGCSVLGTMETEAIREFFVAVANNAKMNIHLSCEYGLNSHHIAEAAFKSFARAMKQAVKIDGTKLPSSKGTL